MSKTCKKRFQLLKDLDLFGKEVELYYRGKSRRTTCIGAFFTIIYVSLYFAAFIYSVYRLFNKYDISFYDSYAFNGEPPNIALNSEIFYGGFALGNVSNKQPFVDDSIY